jgi:hypothetical protein
MRRKVLAFDIRLAGAGRVGGERQRLGHSQPCQCDHQFANHVCLPPKLCAFAPALLPHEPPVVEDARLVRCCLQ